MSIPSIVYKAHATGNDFVVYLDEDGTHEPTAAESPAGGHSPPR